MRLEIDKNALRTALEEAIRAEIIKNFEVGGRMADEDFHLARKMTKYGFGGGTKKWKPSRRAIKQKGRTLVDKGTMMNRVYVKAEPVGDYEFRIIIGSNVVYAPVHQFGKKEKGIPPRPFLTVPDKDIEEILSIVSEYVSVVGGEEIEIKIK